MDKNLREHLNKVAKVRSKLKLIPDLGAHIVDAYKPPSPMRYTGFVYFIQEQGTSFVKIGRADDIRKRLDALQTGNPRPLMLIGYIQETGPNLERKVHAMFRAQSHRGEWFALSEDMKGYISQAGVFLPSPLMSKDG